MELELKHIAPYLPYGLKCHMMGVFKGDYDEDKTPIIAEIKGISQENCPNYTWVYSYADGIDYNTVICDVFPILRPISDLSNDIEIDNKFFTPLAELLKIRYSKWYESKDEDSRYREIEIDGTMAFFKYMANYSISAHFYQADSWSYPPYWMLEKLFEWNFDVFGLIDKKLAVNFNDLFLVS